MINYCSYVVGRCFSCAESDGHSELIGPLACHTGGSCFLSTQFVVNYMVYAVRLAQGHQPPWLAAAVAASFIGPLAFWGDAG